VGHFRHRHTLGEPAGRLLPYLLSLGPALFGQTYTIGISHPSGGQPVNRLSRRHAGKASINPTIQDL
jgi:hypothetical protein